VHQQVTTTRWCDAQATGIDHVEQLLIRTESHGIEQTQPCVLALHIQNQELAADVTADDTDTMPR
jgi:hypothetical protein